MLNDVIGGHRQHLILNIDNLIGCENVIQYPLMTWEHYDFKNRKSENRSSLRSKNIYRIQGFCSIQLTKVTHDR